MNKKSITVIAIILIVILIGAYFSNNSKKNIDNSDMMIEDKMMNENNVSESETMTTEDKMMQEDQSLGDTMMKDEMEVVSKVGSYEAYLPEKISKASTGNVVLFFRASWCPTCISVEKDIKANLQNIPEALTILDVDYDNSTDLKKKYSVTYQHTFVQVDENGKLIKKWSGSPTLSAIVKEVK